MADIFNILSIAIGLIGFLYAVIANRQKIRLENMAKIHLSGIAGDIKFILVSANWAWEHFDNIGNNSINLDRSPEREAIIKSAQQGTGDVSAVSRGLNNVLNHVMCTQEGMFGTTEIRIGGNRQNIENNENKRS